MHQLPGFVSCNSVSIHQRATFPPFTTRPCHHRSLILVWHLVWHLVFIFFLSLSLTLYSLFSFIYRSSKLCLLSQALSLSPFDAPLPCLPLGLCRYLGLSNNSSVRSLLVRLVFVSSVCQSVRSSVSICPSVQSSAPRRGSQGWGEAGGAGA